MVRALAAGIAAAFEAGDTTAARVGIEALRSLVDVAAPEVSTAAPKGSGPIADVVDLASERTKRDDLG